MNSSAFYNALVKRPPERNDEDVSTIFNHLRRLDVFERLHDAPLRSVCRTARLERHPSNYVLFRKGQLATCWYILLSGSVFMNKQVYLPIGCFGKRSNMNLRRMSDCIVISPSDMIVIGYPDVQRIIVQLNNANNGNMASNQQPSTSTAFPAGNSIHQPKIPSALASTTSNTLPFDPSTGLRKQNLNNIVGNHQRIAPYSPPKQRQHQNLYHRFPTAQPNPPPTHFSQPPPQHGLNNHQIQQIPISSATISHRVPSPAPNSSASYQQQQSTTTLTTTLRSSPTKSPHGHPPNCLQYCQPTSTNNNSRNNPQNIHHIKSNSMSESTNAVGIVSQQQNVGGRQFGGGLHSHEIEVPFVRAKGPIQPPPASNQIAKNQNQQMQRQMAIEHHQQQQPQEHFSPPRPPRYTKIYVRPISNSTNSLVHQKKSIFEANSEPNNNNNSTMTQSRNKSINHHSNDQIEEELEEEGEEMGTMKRREDQQLDGEEVLENNSSTLTRQNADKSGKNTVNGIDEKVANDEATISMPPAISNFQRLSKIRLNFSGRKNTQSLNASNPSSNVSVNVPNQMMANVRIRQQSPQNRLPNGQQQIVGHKIRQSTASSISGMTGDESDCFAGLPETAVDSEGPEGEDDDEEEEDDEEGSCPSHDSFQELRDSVRECLEKDPAQRGAEDLAVLIEFMASLPALASLPMAIKRQLCEKMVFALVPQKGTLIMQNGERIDAWSVVVNGSVEHVHSNGHRVEYRVGDCFGVQPICQAQFNDGEIKTLADDCEFVLVEHGDFYSIMSTLSRHVERENDDNSGEIVREVERRMVDNQVELVITKASPDRLLRQLLIDDELLASAGAAADSAQMDSHFVEDFLLMHRVFFSDSALIVRQMIDWFQSEPKHRDRVARIMLIWMNNHFEDFESNDPTGKMTSLLNEFDDLLGDSKMYNHQSLLSITCSVKSQPRQTTLTRSDRNEPLDFQLVGSSSQGGIYIVCVNPNSAAEKNGLKRGDEILEVNSHDFRKMSLAKAEDLMRESTHLSITLKTNWIGFKEAIAQDQVDTGPVFRPNANAASQLAAMPTRYQKKSSAPMMGNSNHFQGQNPQRERRSTLSAALNQSEMHPNSHQYHQKAGSATPTGNGPGGGGAVSSKKVLNKLLHMIRGSSNISGQNLPSTMDEIVHQQQQQMTDSVDEMALPSLSVGAGGGGTLRASRSNPDISAHSLIATSGIGSCSSAASSSCSSSTHRQSSLCTNGIVQADQVLKVYRSDQSFRYIPICGETTAKQLVHLALHEFGIPQEMSGGNDCCWWALYECSVSQEGVIKQKRLPDSANNLTERVGLNGRLYLRDLQKGENTLLPDELIPEVLKQARLHLYTLNAQCIATQLTLQDFSVFSAIEPTEYVNHLFQLTDDENPCSERRSKGWPKLAEFEDLFNKEMWWVATEICCERNVYRRSKLVKKFIKIARHCHMLRNLNSMFAIVSGLEKPAVRRLAHTWERVPGKYLKMLADLQQLMDPSRNMSRYRQHLAQLAQEPPLIPIYPILRKDLTFAHEANPTFCGTRLVNFEKLRMIAQIIRGIQRFSSVHYDPMELLVGSAGGGMIYQPEMLEPGTIRKGGTLMAGIVAGRFGGGSSGGSAGGGLSRKKLFERTLMLKRVKAYLQSMPIIDSEVELDRISLECEPPALSTVQSSSVQQLHQHQSGSSTNTARRRLPSPSPSSLSSQSNQSSSILHHAQQRLPKFGVESPQAVQKMLSLVQNSKIKPRSHHPIGRSQLHQSHGALSASAELPPISANDQRKRTSLASTNSSKTEDGATERAI